MTTWRFMDEEEPREGAWNMAVDDLLFQEAEEGEEQAPTLRLYGWRPHCLSIGFHQEYREACDQLYCRTAGYDVVRRPTGGKAVLHAQEVTYAVVARQDRPPFAGLSLEGTYGLIAEALAASLEWLGLPVVLTRRTLPITPRGGAPCFLVPSEKELLVRGRKVVGSAQRRGRRSFLQHGAVPLHVDYEGLRRATGRGEEEAERYKAAFAGVADLLPGISARDVKAALRIGFERSLRAEWEERPLTGAERAQAEVLKARRYGSALWTQKGPGEAGRTGDSPKASFSAFPSPPSTLHSPPFPSGLSKHEPES
ncbi:MAG: lipoate--protein ligase family protein [Acidobacteriota bacterium]